MMKHTTQTLQRNCACGGTCGSCANESQLRRSAIVSRNGRVLGEDPIHQPMLDERRAEGLDPEGFPDAYFKYGCPPGQGASRLTVDVQPVRIAQDDGSNPTTAPALGVASTLWPRCCVNLNVLPTTTINRTSLQTITSSGGSTASTEEVELLNAVQGPNRITVVTFRNFESGGTTSTTTRGGAGTAFNGTTQPVVFAVDIAVGEVIAHEIGHALGYGGTHLARDTGTIMEPSNSPTTPNPVHVSQPVCQIVRTSRAATAGQRCCQSFT